MKILLLILLIVTSSLFKAQTNVYHPFPTVSGFWHQKSTSGGHYQFGIMGDTVINNLTWHKIYLETNCNIYPVMTSTNSTFVGGLREDSIKRVFFYNIGNSSYISPNLTNGAVYKLYDFSAQAGDTIHLGAVPPYNVPYLVVDLIDSVYTYNHYRKRFNLSSGYETWIEGIGSTRALASVIHPYLTCSCYTTLFCFQSSNIPYYIKAPYQDCYDENVGITEFQNNEDHVSVFPNPFSEETTINIGYDANDLSLIIYNTFGQQVKQINHITGKSVTLKSEDLSDGMYYCYMMENDKINSTHKIVVKVK